MAKRGTSIAVLSASMTPHAAAVGAALERLGAAATFIELGHGLTPPTLTLTGGEPSTTVPLEGLRAGYIDVLSVAVPRAFVARDSYWLYDDWHRDWMQAQDRRALLNAWLGRLEARGVTLVNPPLGYLAQEKPAQLAALAGAGLPVPPFVITSDPAEAARFLEAHPDAVVKPALGGGFCVPIGRGDVERLDQLRRAPAIFQARVRGPDVRVTALADRVLSAVAIDVEGDAVDYRANPAYAAGTTRYVPMTLAPKVVRLCLRAMALCGLHLAGIDLKIDADGKVSLLECNAAPGWLAIEAATGAPIAEGIATYLMRLAGLRLRKARPPRAEAKRGPALVEYALPVPRRPRGR